MEQALRRASDHWVGSFRAMAGPCEALIDTDDRRDAGRVLSIVASEARRIEAKYSRYRDDSVVARIHRAPGADVELDDESLRLVDYAACLWELSGGKFDVTSGVLRRAWTFDGSDRVPSAEAVGAVLPHVGWPRVRRSGRRIRLEPGMEIDLGGIAKEYAADRAARLVAGEFPGVSCLVNLGGDIAVVTPRRGNEPWRVGVEPARDTSPPRRLIRLVRGGLATSGDARRFLLRDGVRYSHILDPRTGWPVPDAPHAVTAAAGTCTDAGALATLAMLEGRRAERFLAAQGVAHWIER